MVFCKAKLCDMTEKVLEIYSQFWLQARRNQDDVITFDLNYQSAAQVIVQSDNKTYINYTIEGTKIFLGAIWGLFWYKVLSYP